MRYAGTLLPFQRKNQGISETIQLYVRTKLGACERSERSDAARLPNRMQSGLHFSK